MSDHMPGAEMSSDAPAHVPADAPVGEFAGLSAIVTGGASGIGLATATLLAAGGAHVACLDLTPVSVPAPLVGVHCDVAGDASVRAAVDAVVARFGGLDIVVANAGIGAQGAVDDNDDAEWHRVLDVNVVGIARTVRASLAHLRHSHSPAVVLNTSIAAWAGLQQRAVYSASKGAVQALGLAMAAARCLPSTVGCTVCAPPARLTPAGVRRSGRRREREHTVMTTRPHPGNDGPRDGAPAVAAVPAEPMTVAQRSYLQTLAREAGEDVPEPEPTKAAASLLIQRLQRATGRIPADRAR